MFDPFGNAVTSPGTLTMPLRFPGQYADAERALNQNWFRDYDPTIGRYVESDPAGLFAGLNTYSYANSDPLAVYDVTGLQGVIPLYPVAPPTPGNSSGVKSVHDYANEGRAFFNLLGKLCNYEWCREQWIKDTRWCDNNFKEYANVACHRWAQAEFYRCQNDLPSQPFIPPE